MKDSFKIALQQFVDLAHRQVIGDGVKDSKELSQFLPKRYHGLRVHASLGQGRATSVPWISFLAEGQTTSKGIYPVFLLYLKQNVLILAYGVSESQPSEQEWPEIDQQTIGEFFLSKYELRGVKYSRSIIFKVYNTSNTLNFVEIDKNLEEITKQYISILSNWGHSNTPLLTIPIKDKVKNENTKIAPFKYLQFQQASSMKGIYFRNDLILRFVSTLITKPFLILTGLSGSGKTLLASSFAKWVCEYEGQYRIIAVGADWTNRDQLLGYPDALHRGQYIKPDNGVLDLILDAGKDPENPYFLILDEMNLSHVERYFADFLSAMELSGDSRSIALHSNADDPLVRHRLPLPTNLFIIGTVNIDETTYMFSPKVLDRANVIEFRIDAEEMASYLGPEVPLDPNSSIIDGNEMAKDFVRLSQQPIALQPDIRTKIAEELNRFFTSLQTAGAEFGYRSASEILRFASMVHLLEPTKDIDWIMDAAIMQKLLPKLHGSRRKLSPVLETLASFCWRNDPQKLEVLTKRPDQPQFKKMENCKYPITLEKLHRMYKNLGDNGFASYAEA